MYILGALARPHQFLYRAEPPSNGIAGFIRIIPAHVVPGNDPARNSSGCAAGASGLTLGDREGKARSAAASGWLAPYLKNMKWPPAIDNSTNSGSPLRGTVEVCTSRGFVAVRIGHTVCLSTGRCIDRNRGVEPLSSPHPKSSTMAEHLAHIVLSDH